MPRGDDRLATVTSVSTETEAQIVVNFLQESGIEAATSGGFTSQFRAWAPGKVRILVHQENLCQARSLLAEQRQLAVDLEEDGGDESPNYQTNLRRLAVRTVLVLMALYTLITVIAWVTTRETSNAVWAAVSAAVFALVLFSRRTW